MKGNKNTPKDIRQRIKPPYSKEETRFLFALITSGFKQLQDIGQKVNYEQFCESIVSSIPSSMEITEFSSYWSYWGKKFKQGTKRDARDEIFRGLVLDLKIKGLLPSDTIGLTGNFSQRIQDILEENKGAEEEKINISIPQYGPGKPEKTFKLGKK